MFTLKKLGQMTYGDLIDELSYYNPSHVFDPDVVGLGLWRDNYKDIALFHDTPGVTVLRPNLYDSGVLVHYDVLPRRAGELREFLKSNIGCYIRGYRGGFQKIGRNMRLWFEADESCADSYAVVGLSQDLEIIAVKMDGAGN